MSAPLLVMLLAATPAAPQDPVIRQLVETRNFRNGTPTAIQMDPRGRYVLFLRSPGTSTVQSLQVFDVASGQSRELLSADVLLQGTTQQLTDAERAQLERRRVSARGFLRFSLAEDGRSLITALSGKLYRVDVEALLAGRSAEQSVRQLSPTDALDPTLSRDGKKLSYVKDWDLHAKTYEVREEGGSISLWCRDAWGKQFRQKDEPVAKVVRYKREDSVTGHRLCWEAAAGALRG